MLLILSMSSMLIGKAAIVTDTTLTGFAPVKIGEQVPDIKFRNVVNWPNTEAKLSDFKGKLIILDFWATWCAPCIASIPKLDSLQQHFGDKLMVMQVTYEDSTMVQKFRKANAKLKHSKLPSATEDRTLSKLFPYVMVPHIVLIDSDGALFTTTHYDEITKENLQAILDKKKIKLKSKSDRINTDYNKPLLFGGLDSIHPLDISELHYSSMLTKQIDGLRGQSGGPNNYDQYSKVLCTNLSIEQLYLTAFSQKGKPFIGPDNPDFNLHFSSRIIWNVNDTTLHKGNWNALPKFCYELVAPKADSASLQQWMINDLNRYFGNLYDIEARIVNKRVNCLVLARTSKTKNWLSSGGVDKEWEINKDTEKIRVKNYRINDFLFHWMYFIVPLYPLPILNETGIIGLIDIDLNADPTNIYSMNKALAQYGLAFKKAKRKVKMVLIENRSK